MQKINIKSKSCSFAGIIVGHWFLKEFLFKKVAHRQALNVNTNELVYFDPETIVNPVKVTITVE